jgi:hypothetical protein
MARNWTKPNNRKYYAVRKGYEDNVIVDNWIKCRDLVNGYKGAIFKSFPTMAAAEAYLKENSMLAPITTITTLKAKPKKNETLNERFNRLNPCTERKSYTDPLTGEYYHNRCVKRKHPRVLTGINYKPGDDNSIPWD